MIQRPQSIFLVVIVIAAIVAGLNPIWLKIGEGQTAQIAANGITHNTTLLPSFVLLAGLFVFSIIALVSLLQFKNRKLQMLLGMINSLVIAACLGFVFYQVFKVAQPLFLPEQEGQFKIGFFALVAAFLCNMVANRLIRRDEMLVRSADRMR
jgi:surface polysaccharide O-acyltransferase-like enzyme